MSSFFRIAALLLISEFVPTPLSAQPAAWPSEQDIPRPGPATVGLAGSAEPDVVRYLLARGVARARISPDGQTVAYVSSLTGVPQVWTQQTAGGEPRQITFGAGVDCCLQLFPDGSGALVTADAAGDEKTSMSWLALNGRSERVIVPPSEAYVRFGDWSPDGDEMVYASTERNGRDYDIWLADLRTGTTRRVFDGSYGYTASAWRPGSRQVIISEVRGEDANDVHLLDMASMQLVPVFRPEVASAYRRFNWLTDGSAFYFVTNQDREFMALARYEPASQTLSIVESPPHDIVNVELSANGRYLIWQTDESGLSRLYGRDLVTGQMVESPALPAGVYSIDGGARVAPIFSVRVSGPNAPGDVWVWNVATGDLRRVIASTDAGLDLDTMITPTAIRFSARDGVVLNALLYRPRLRSGNSKSPVYIQLHGGPSAHATPEYDGFIQYLVARGIAVLDLNYRGSTGSGKTYARLNDRRLRPNEIGDIADAADWAAGQPDLDGRRVAVGGISYGGYLTNAVLAAYPDRFVAGVSMVGVSHWSAPTEGEEVHPELEASDREEYGDFGDPGERPFFESISPINVAQNIRTPMLVQHGANDPRNPVIQSDAMVLKVRAAGTPVIYFRHPDEGHLMSKLSNRVHFYQEMALFLEERFQSAGDR